MTALEYEQQVSHRRQSVFRDWTLLRAILDRKEGTIAKRWTNKTGKAKLSLLLAAWPDMPGHHRPDIKAWRLEGQDRIIQHGHRHTSAMLWPMINQEDLLKPKALPLILHSRQSSPSVFAFADLDNARSGIATGAVAVSRIEGHSATFQGENPEDYGRLLPLRGVADLSEDTWELHACGGFGCPPGEALLITRIQERLMRFLLDVCQAILHEFTMEDIERMPSGVKKPQESTVHPPDPMDMQALALEARYQVPSGLDLDRLKQLLAMRLNNAKDHLMALREDPAYFCENLWNIKQHWPEEVEYEDGTKDDRSDSADLWSKCVDSLICNALRKIELFDELHEQAIRLAALQKTHANEIRLDAQLPPQFLAALLLFRATLGEAALLHLSDIRTSFPASPPMRDVFRRVCNTTLSSSNASTVVLTK